jgi:hypothetical protein
MDWISVEARVPDDRRRVIAWGEVRGWGPISRPRGQFLGGTRYSPARGGGIFECERGRGLPWVKVTHWAEIVGPGQAQEAA